jgi:hypothetical protein
MSSVCTVTVFPHDKLYDLGDPRSAPSETSEGTLTTTTNRWLEIYWLKLECLSSPSASQIKSLVILAFLRLDGGLR